METNELLKARLKALFNDLNQVKAQIHELTKLETRYEGAIESMQLLIKEQDNEDKHI